MRRWLPFAVGLAVTVVCARLGMWQLERLQERRRENALQAATLADTIMVPGVFDRSRDSVVPHRALRGAPGVWILTPIRLRDGAEWTVLRGFVPSPDGRAVDRSALAEPDSAQVTGVFVDGVLRRIALPPGAPEPMAAVPPPVLTDGPHLGYAIQWFAFAVIGFVGGVVLSVRAGRSNSRGEQQQSGA